VCMCACVCVCVCVSVYGAVQVTQRLAKQSQRLVLDSFGAVND